MATTMARKRKSDEMDNGPSTPTESPRKKMKITQAQKQALIDNLQLEGWYHLPCVGPQLTDIQLLNAQDNFELNTRYNVRT